MKKIRLNDGTEIPVLGLGVFMLTPQEAEQAVYDALSSGYQLIDTANAYMNERAVGRGIKKSKVRREDIYLSTKLWPSVYSDADQAIDETLERLDTNYIDLLFLHQPVGDYMEAYKAMERTVKAGKVKSLGLSNFSLEKIKEIIQFCEIKPAVLQVEAHPYYPQDELKEYILSFGGRLMAWYPLGHGDRNLLNEGVFSSLAKKYHKSNVQIILRWHIQVGNVVIPGSKNKNHINDNADIFDFELTRQELEDISKLNSDIRYYYATKETLKGYLNFSPNFNEQE